ncbi:hypothetical protein C7N83_09025 [Neisseria iguanae]|uniref:Uncharacterized protein n=1 Tax=Neisseria iguanae TaxID=90242 RepID=A0A2P7TZ57_9NEIS|nr:hypothetical protein C7N83_09025 [Neisseria iguanae]
MQSFLSGKAVCCRILTFFCYQKLYLLCESAGFLICIRQYFQLCRLFFPCSFSFLPAFLTLLAHYYFTDFKIAAGFFDFVGNLLIERVFLGDLAAISYYTASTGMTPLSQNACVFFQGSSVHGNCRRQIRYRQQ